MTVDWRRIGGYARKAVALATAAFALYVIYNALGMILFGPPDRWAKVAEPGMLLFGVAVLIIGICLWMWPKRRRWLASAIAALLVTPVLGVVIGTWIHSRASQPHEFILEPLRTGDPYFLSALAVSWVIAISVWRYQPAPVVVTAPTTDPVASQAVTSLSSSDVALPPSDTAHTTSKTPFLPRLSAQRGAISRGSYVAAVLWFFALLFTMIDSAAFIGGGGHVLAFVGFLLVPVAVLFALDWVIGRRGTTA